jgi:hypothetical protein
MCATDESNLGSCACPGERIVLRRGKGRAAQERYGIHGFCLALAIA